MKLLASQKDTLFDLIEKAGLSPSQFVFMETASKISRGQSATNLLFTNSDYFYLFETGPNTTSEHYALFCPGKSAHTEQEYPGGWDVQLTYFRQWVSNLVREISSPNKWDRLQKEIASIGISFENDTDKFSFNEYEDLKNRMLTLKKEVITLGIPPEQIDIINKKLDHLTELAKDMNKFDWKGLFIGTIVSVVVQLSLSPEIARSFWTLIKFVFNNYLLP